MGNYYPQSKVVSYLPDNLSEWKYEIIDAINYFQDFYADLMSNELPLLSTIFVLASKSKIEQPFKREQGKSAIDFWWWAVKRLVCSDEPTGGWIYGAWLYFADHIQTDVQTSVLISTHLIAG